MSPVRCSTGAVEMPYYYACSYPLTSGSVVEKGNWGRMLRQELIGPGNAARLLREVVFEKVRLQCYPNRPSRFDCNFVCPTVESANQFVKSANRIFDLIYEVEFTDPNASQFETDWSLIKIPENLTLVQAESLAHQYWSPKNVNPMNKEILVASGIRILKRISTSRIT